MCRRCTNRLPLDVVRCRGASSDGPYFVPDKSRLGGGLALRHQLQVLQRSRPRHLRLTRADRVLWVRLARIWSGWRTTMVVVKPAAVIAWHQHGFLSVLDVEIATSSGSPESSQIRFSAGTPAVSARLARAVHREHCAALKNATVGPDALGVSKCGDYQQ